MGKYSTDSDNEKRGSKSSNKSRSRHRSSSSESKSRRRKRRSRSRSRGKHSRSRRSRSSSPHKSKSRRQERSRYRERHHKSRSRSKTRHRRSRSRSYIREYSSKCRRKSSSSSSSPEVKRVSSMEANPKQEEPKALDIQKIDVKVLNAINEDGFVPKPFTSKSKKMDNIVIDLQKQTIKVPDVEPVEPDSIFHHNLFMNEEARIEKWIKELYGFRQKALQQGLKAGEK